MRFCIGFFGLAAMSAGFNWKTGASFSCCFGKRVTEHFLNMYHMADAAIAAAQTGGNHEI